MTSTTGYAACIKYTMFVFNFFVCLFGIVLIALGSWLVHLHKEFFRFFNQEEITVPTILIMAGIIATIAGFIGCWGAIRESSCLLTTYAVLVFVIVVIEIAAGVYGFNKRDELKNELAKNIVESMMKYNKENDTKEAWDNTHDTFDCCGANNYTDWVFINLLHASNISDNINPFLEINHNIFDLKTTKSFVNASRLSKEKLLEVYRTAGNNAITELTVRSCCNKKLSINENCTTISPSLRQQGCLMKTQKWIETHMDVVAVIAITIAIIEVMGIVVACYLACHLRNNENKSVASKE